MAVRGVDSAGARRGAIRHRGEFVVLPPVGDESLTEAPPRPMAGIDGEFWPKLTLEASVARERPDETPPRCPERARRTAENYNVAVMADDRYRFKPLRPC